MNLDSTDTTTFNLGGNSAAVAGTDYDQIVVSGSSSTIGLTGTLAINTLPDLSASGSTTFTLLNNQTGHAVSGTFTGLPDNSTFTVSGWTFRINYEGGPNSDNVQLVVVNAPTFSSPYVIQNANNVILSGLNLASGVKIINSTNITITNDTIGASGNPFDGISVDSASSNITISNDTIAANGGAGVNLAGSGHVTVSGNDIYGNFKGGVLINGASSDTISGNTIGDGISLLSASNIVIQSNTIGVDSSGHTLNNPFDGIYVDSGSSAIIIGGAGASNTIADNGGSGVEVAGSTVTVANNDIYGNTVVGVLINGGSGVAISGNTVGDSVELDSATNVAIQSNYIGVDSSNNSLGNQLNGVYVNPGSSTITMSGNTIADNGGAGIVVAGSTVSVSGNTISNDTVGGVLVAGGDSDTISGNTIGDGISLFGATNTVIQGNYIGVNSSGASLNNPNDGIYVDSGSSTITIGGTGSGAGNTINDNGGAGLDLAGTAITVAGNTISGNTNAGVLVAGGSGVSLNGNSLDSLSLSAGDATIASAATIASVTVSGGSLTAAASLNVSGSFNESGGSTFVNSGATLNLTGSVSFNGGLLALQGGTVQASSPLQIQSGATLAGAGTIAASLVNNGTLALGAPFARGTLTVTGNYTQTSTGQLNVTLDSQSLTALDHLMVNGVATLNGNLNVALAPGYTPAAGNVFEPLEYGSRAGAFAALNLPPYSGGSLAGHYDDPLYPNALSLWAS